jgi:acetyltransferase-like isoleucine patch superfamily enzyme/GT2 family glycosyltransferase
VIVVDGGSTDGTQEAIAPFRNRLAAFVSEKDHGIGDAWNKGLRMSRGRYVALLNCGDSWTPDYVSRHVRELARDPMVIQYGTTFMTEHGAVVERLDRPFDPARLEDGFGFIHTSVMTSRAVYEQVGEFDINRRIAVDTDWMLRAHKRGIPFHRVAVHNFMATGGVSAAHWLRGQLEYLDALEVHGLLPRRRWRADRRKRLQSLYRRSGLPRLRSHWRMQLSLMAVAFVNALHRLVPFHAPRRALWAAFGIHLHPLATVHQGIRLLARRRLSIGEGSVVNRGTLIDNRCDVEVGRHVSIAHDCRIYTTGRDYCAPDFGIEAQPVCIEDHAVLFAGAVIMPGVTVGRGAVVLPFSVVTRNVPPMAVVGGAPAVRKGERTEEPNYRLQSESHWFVT